MKEDSQIRAITDKLQLVIDKYKHEFEEVDMNRDYLPLKISEEWGECLQAYLMLTDRGRQKGKTKEEIRNSFSEEIADVVSYLFLLAKQEGVNIESAIANKWFKYLEQ
jgi:NTP pyrophosphatase (non-canonical NTP hydrolase)